MDSARVHHDDAAYIQLHAIMTPWVLELLAVMHDDQCDGRSLVSLDQICESSDVFGATACAVSMCCPWTGRQLQLPSSISLCQEVSGGRSAYADSTAVIDEGGLEGGLQVTLLTR